MSSVSSIQKQRHVPVEGATNVRNLGGYPAAGGKTTKWGVIYRGDMLADVPPEAAQAIIIDQLHVHNTYDLRADDEVSKKNYDIAGISHARYPLMSHHFEDLVKIDGVVDGETMRQLMATRYRYFLRSRTNTLGALIKDLIAASPTEQNAAYIHCTAGKDRTGIICFLILALVGVPEETIREDYLLTNIYYKKPAFWREYMHDKLDDEAAEALWTVQPVYFDALVDEINTCGGARQYALEYLNMTDTEVNRLAELFLE